MRTSLQYAFLFSLLLACFASEAQTYYTMNAANNGQTFTVNCAGNNVFRDDGPTTTHYSNNQDYTISFCSGSSNLLSFDFGCASCFTVDRIHPSDTLFIYDGIGTSGILLAAVTGNPANTNKLDYFFGGGGTNNKFLSLSSCITFRFKADAANNEDGWEMGITCVPPISCGNNPAASDLFGGAPFICNLNGYCGTTSSNYDQDFPANLTDAGGSCPGPLFGGTIENNSWLKFQASAATVNFGVNVGGCSNGIQIAIFSYNGTSFTRMSDCALSDGGHTGNFTLTGTGLTPGQNYYIMVDGSAGDVCNYTISAQTGVATINAGVDQAICSGGNTNLTATGPSGSTYSWTAVGGGFGPVVGNPINVSPSSTTQYIVEGTGAGSCQSKKDTVQVTVNACAACAVNNITAGTQTACVPASNTYTQQVTVTYTNPPGSGNLVVNGQSFAITASPQTVTLTGLSANGSPVNVTASFSADPACTLTVNGLFTAPISCSGGACTPNNGTWD